MEKRNHTWDQVKDLARKHKLPPQIVKWRLDHGWPLPIIGAKTIEEC